jgi:hypothetical protein
LTQDYDPQQAIEREPKAPYPKKPMPPPHPDRQTSQVDDKPDQEKTKQ